MNRNILLISHIKRFWLPYINEHPDCVNRDYFQVLKRFPKAEQASLRGLWDEDGTLQAAAAIDIDSKPLFLELLLTAPWRKKGSGSRLLLEIVQESYKVGSKGAVELKSAPTAVGFYLKYGFEIVKPAEKEGWDTPMRLTAATAKSLLAQATVTNDGVKLVDIILCPPSSPRS